MVDSRLRAVGQHLRQREQHRLKLTSYSPADYKPGAADAEMVPLLDAIAKEENLAVSELVLLLDDVRTYSRATGKGHPDLRGVDEFRAFRSAKTVACGCPGSKHRYVFVSKPASEPASRDSIQDVRFFVELETQSYQVLELAHDLLQFWEIFLRHHTTLDVRAFSADVQTGLLGRVTDTVFYQAVKRQLAPISDPAPTSASIETLQAEISQRLGNVAFYLEERDILRPALAKYTGRTFCDASNEDAKRDRTRIRNVETGVLHELIHLADSVRKWLDKQGRASELAVIELFRPFRIGANLVNVLKHGVRGRNHDCAVIELEMTLFAQTGDVPTPDDSVRDVAALVNYGGKLYSLTQLIEDICQLWQLFLQYHSTLSLTEFQVRLGRVLLARKALNTYSAPVPTGLDAWAQQQADRRRQLDLK